MPNPQPATPRESTEAMVRNITRELAEIERPSRLAGATVSRSRS